MVSSEEVTVLPPVLFGKIFGIGLNFKEHEIEMTSDIECRIRMASGELRGRREYLGMSQAALGAVLSVKEDTVRNWERGKDPVPYRIPGEIAALGAHTRLRVEEVADSLRRGDSGSAAAQTAEPIIRAYGIR